MSATVRYGLFNAAASICFTLLLYVTGLNRTESSQTIGMIGLIFPIIFMYLAITEYKRNEGRGYISFGKAFRQGFTVGAIGGIIGTLFYLVYVSAIDPGYTEHIINVAIAKAEEQGQSQEMIDQQIMYMEKFMTPGWTFAWGLIVSLFFSAILATIMAGILKKPNPEEIA